MAINTARLESIRNEVNKKRNRGVEISKEDTITIEKLLESFTMNNPIIVGYRLADATEKAFLDVIDIVTMYCYDLIYNGVREEA